MATATRDFKTKYWWYSRKANLLRFCLEVEILQLAISTAGPSDFIQIDDPETIKLVYEPKVEYSTLFEAV